MQKRWDGQYPRIWVTNGGGGTFANIWTPDTFAQAGFYVSNTKNLTPAVAFSDDLDTYGFITAMLGTSSWGHASSSQPEVSSGKRQKNVRKS